MRAVADGFSRVSETVVFCVWGGAGLGELSVTSTHRQNKKNEAVCNVCALFLFSRRCSLAT